MRTSALPGALFRDIRGRFEGEAPPPREPGYWKPSPEAVAGPYPAFRPRATDDLRLGWDATHRALAEIKRLADQAGAVALELASSGVEIYLADDGHWSPTGNAVVARELARAVGAPE